MTFLSTVPYLLFPLFALAGCIVFPLYTGIQAWRKGNKGAAVAVYCSISTIFLSFPVALIVFFVCRIWEPNLDVSPRLYSFFLCGTVFYGATDRADDGSFLTTEWLAVFLLPIVPIQSYRVSFGGANSDFFGGVSTTTKRYYIQSNEKLNSVHVLRGYALLIGLFLIPVLLMLPISSFSSASNPIWALPFCAIMLAYIVLMVRLLRAK